MLISVAKVSITILIAPTIISKATLKAALIKGNVGLIKYHKSSKIGIKSFDIISQTVLITVDITPNTVLKVACIAGMLDFTHSKTSSNTGKR